MKYGRHTVISIHILLLGKYKKLLLTDLRVRFRAYVWHRHVCCMVEVYGGVWRPISLVRNCQFKYESELLNFKLIFSFNLNLSSKLNLKLRMKFTLNISLKLILELKLNLKLKLKFHLNLTSKLHSKLYFHSYLFVANL